MGNGLVSDGVISASDEQAAQLWRLREGITESLARYKPYKNDVSVRISAMPAFLAETQALIGQAYPHFDVVWFGHIGDGNLHINVLGAGEHAARITDVALQGAIDLDGTISAEHGIGVAKAVWLERLKGPSTMAALRSVKRALDPSGVFNPGVLLPA